MSPTRDTRSVGGTENTIHSVSAPYFRKSATLNVSDALVATGGEKVVTTQKDDSGEYVETENFANEGDVIVNRDGSGDRYIVPKEKFAKLYEQDGDVYRSKNMGHAEYLDEDTEITPPWGGVQNIKAGGVKYFSASGEVYGNQEHSFTADFDRVSKDLSESCSQSRPLDEQLSWANKHAKEHVDDVIFRIKRNLGNVATESYVSNGGDPDVSLTGSEVLRGLRNDDEFVQHAGMKGCSSFDETKSDFLDKVVISKYLSETSNDIENGLSEWARNHGLQVAETLKNDQASPKHSV